MAADAANPHQTAIGTAQSPNEITAPPPPPPSPPSGQKQEPQQKQQSETASEPTESIRQSPETSKDKSDDGAKEGQTLSIPASDEPGGAPSSATTDGVAVITSDDQKGKDKDDDDDDPSSSSPPPPPPPPPTSPPAPKEEDDSLSIEPSSADQAQSFSSSAGPAAASTTCTITLLLPTGARHPYKIDEKYLSKRGVEIPEPGDPFSISVYKLKELILREWREEWEGKPASPSSIRLIHFGKLLDDKEMLKKYHLSKDTPNVVHMSVRPAEMMEEDEGAKGGKASSRESRSGRERSGGGCCVIL